MKNKNPALIISLFALVLFIGGFFIWLFLDPFHREKGAVKITPAPKQTIEKLTIPTNKLPIIKMGLKNNNHEVELAIKKLPKSIIKVEYDFIYNAKDNKGRDFEKGQYDSIDLEGRSSADKSILLGTASCTTGRCRYRYDQNVDSGRLLLRMKDKEGKIASAESPFLIIYPKKSVDLSSLFGDTDNGDKETKAANEGNGYIIINRSPNSPQPIKIANYRGPFYVSSSNPASFLKISSQDEVEVLNNGRWQKSPKAIVSPGRFFIIASSKKNS